MKMFTLLLYILQLSLILILVLILITAFELIIQSQMRTILIILALLKIISTQDPALCPQDNGLIQSGRLSFSSSLTQSTSATIPNKQTLTYNYTLVQPFINIPGVSISINSFQSQSSPFLMFAVKPLLQNQTSGSMISLLLRFYQRYTTWTLISFGFLAEDRADIQADYIQLDTALLSTDTPGKAVKATLPVKSAFPNASAVYFINGFQLASLPLGGIVNRNTPFEVQIQGVSSNNSDLNLLISTTTATQVYSLMVSYIVFQNSSNLYFGAFEYNPSGGTTTTFLSTTVKLPLTPLAQLSGFSGFILPNIDGSTSFSMSLTNSSYQFTFSPGINYLSYHYFAVTAKNICFSCQQHSFVFNGTCIASCPNGTNLLQGVCYTCNANQTWNGTACQILCRGGMKWNTVSNKCQCLASMFWNGIACISCPTGQIWNSAQRACSCAPTNPFWDGMACRSVECQANQFLNPISLQCECKPSYFLNGSNCVSCSNTMIWNGTQCVCLPNYTRINQDACTNCTGGRIWNTATQRCSCTNNTHFNGIQCITCNGGMVFDSLNNKCACPANQLWNASSCVVPCTAPLVYNNQQCTCPINTTLSRNGSCSPSPTCASTQTWNGTACAPISCSTGSFWNGSVCVQYSETCPLDTYWNGKSCATLDVNCPSGSVWNGSYCTAANNCPTGTYYKDGQCQYFPVICLPNYAWNGTGCLAVGLAASCLNLQVFNGTACVDVNCSQGRVWSATWNQCVCNASSFWNGLSCLDCPSGQIYVSGACACPDGYFMIQSTCYSLKEMYCSYVSNSQWNGTNCVCNPGFTVVGTTCVCYGLLVGSVCNICYNIQNSVAKNGVCVCQVGYYMYQGQCKAYSSNNTATGCQPGAILANGTCVPCSDGCLSCISQSVCVQCRPEYTYSWATYSCLENCGDGMRFSLACDDGNNINGDGCSSLCQIQSGFTCFGGSPNSKDVCTQAIPSVLTVNLTGTSHLNGKIVVNLKTNYLPSNITNPPNPCTYLCDQTLKVRVTAGDNQYVSINRDYFPGTLSFAVEIEYGREPIGQFTLQVSFDQNIAGAYFPGILTNESFLFTINPAFLSVYIASDKLN